MFMTNVTATVISVGRFKHENNIFISLVKRRPQVWSQ